MSFKRDVESCGCTHPMGHLLLMDEVGRIEGGMCLVLAELEWCHGFEFGIGELWNCAFEFGVGDL